MHLYIPTRCKWYLPVLRIKKYNFIRPHKITIPHCDNESNLSITPRSRPRTHCQENWVKTTTRALVYAVTIYITNVTACKKNKATIIRHTLRVSSIKIMYTGYSLVVNEPSTQIAWKMFLIKVVHCPSCVTFQKVLYPIPHARARIYEKKNLYI